MVGDEAQSRVDSTAVVCRLDDEWTHRFAEVAQELADLSTGGVVVPGRPHISLQVIQGELSEEAKRALREGLKSQEAFSVYFRGLGRFLIPRPVVYVTVVRNRGLERLHRRVRRVLRSFGVAADRLYSRRRWVPHVSLLLDDNGEAIMPRLRDFETKGAFQGSAKVRTVEILGPRGGEPEVVWSADERES